MIPNTRVYFGRYLAIIFSMFLVSGCTIPKPGLDAWEGHSIDELIKAWGEPASRTRLGENYEAYTWVDETDTCKRTFTVRDDKIIGLSDDNCSG